MLQPDALRHLPAPAHGKADVVYQSARTLAPFRRKASDRLHCLLVRAPSRRERSAHGVRSLAPVAARRSRDRLSIIGAALEPALGEAARSLAADDARVQVLGARPHAWTRQAIKRAHLLIVPSRMEGGANVVVEAVTSGTPVLASRISGNLGMLGDDYPGYFAVGDAAGLAASSSARVMIPRFLASLAPHATRALRRFTPAAERAALIAAVERAHAPSPPVEWPRTPQDPLRHERSRTRSAQAHLVLPRRRLRLQDRAGGAAADHLEGRPALLPKALLVGIETADDAAVYQINEHQAIVATTDFFMPIVDDPYDFGAIAATNAISDVYAMGGTPLFALALVGMPINQLPVETIRRVLEGGEAVCAKAGIPIAGGHTIDSVEPIYGLVAIGLVDPKHS